MNILADGFPVCAEIGGQEYALNTDFRAGLQIMLAQESRELTRREKNLVMLRLLYKEVPPDIQKACEMAVFFLDCGEERGRDEQGPPARLYSFGQDAKYIYSAIRQTHGIDLERVEYLHWWKFCYLFLDLNQDCFFQQMIHLRRQKQRCRLSREEREVYNRLYDILELDMEKDAQTRRAEADFLARLSSGPARGGRGPDD